MADLSYHCMNSTENFGLMACLQMKLWLVKVGKLDACIRSLFANSVTYINIAYACLVQAYIATRIANLHVCMHDHQVMVLTLCHHQSP